MQKPALAGIIWYYKYNVIIIIIIILGSVEACVCRNQHFLAKASSVTTSHRIGRCWTMLLWNTQTQKTQLQKQYTNTKYNNISVAKTTYKQTCKNYSDQTLSISEPSPQLPSTKIQTQMITQAPKHINAYIYISAQTDIPKGWKQPKQSYSRISENETHSPSVCCHLFSESTVTIIYYIFLKWKFANTQIQIQNSWCNHKQWLSVRLWTVSHSRHAQWLGGAWW